MTIRWRSPLSFTGFPSTSMMRSSGRMPAAAAGLPGTTCTTSTPWWRPTSFITFGGRGRPPPAIPRYARRNRPSLMSAPMIRLVTSSMGTARPSPMPATAVFTPTTRPDPSASAPPEFPGFSAASVWITLSTTRWFLPDREGPPERAHHSGGDRSAEAHRVPDGNDELPHSQVARVPELRGNQVPRVHPEDGEVGQRIGPHDVERRLPTVGEGGAASIHPMDHVGRRETEPIRGDHEPGSRPFGSAPAGDALGDPQAGHRGREPLGHRGDHARISVEGLVLIGGPELVGSVRSAHGLGYHQKQNLLGRERACRAPYSDLPSVALKTDHDPVPTRTWICRY